MTAIRNGMRLEWRDPRTLQPNPKNPKRHGSFQRQAFADFFDDVGWAGALLFNERTGHILDGHMRQEEALERNLMEVPVLIVDVDEATETKILALRDKIGALFDTDAQLLAQLSLAMELESDVLKKVLAGEEDAAAPAAGAAAKSGNDLLPKGGLSLNLGEAYNYVVLLFRTEMDWTVAQDHLGIEKVRCIFTKGVGTGRVVDGGAYLRRALADRFPSETELMARVVREQAEREAAMRAAEGEEADVPSQA